MRRKSTARLAVPVVVFSVIALLCGLFVYSIVANATYRQHRTIKAVFLNASGLTTGSDVEVGGVSVGSITGLRLLSDNRVEATFTVADDIPLTTTTSAVIRWRDLLGRRILELEKGATTGTSLPAGSTIPASRTQPALSLDQLYNGFEPLFQGLNPTQLNELSTNLVAVLQGQGGNLESILQSAASLSTSVANRDRTIGALVSDLHAVLQTVQQRAPQTDQLVVNLQQLVTRLAQDRGQLVVAIAGIAGSTSTLAGFISHLRPSASGDLSQIARLSQVVNADRANLNTLLQRIPGYYTTAGRAGIYASAFQFYLCGVQLRFATAGGVPSMTPMTISQEPRCQP